MKEHASLPLVSNRLRTRSDVRSGSVVRAVAARFGIGEISLRHGQGRSEILARDMAVYLHGNLLGMSAYFIARRIGRTASALRVADRRFRARLDADASLRESCVAIERALRSEGVL